MAKSITVYVLYFFLALVETSFKPFSMAAMDSYEASDLGGGDFFRQIAFSFSFIIMFCVYYKLFPLIRLKCFYLIILMIAYCALSSIWSDVTSISIKRTVLLFFSCFTVFFIVSILSYEEILDVISKTYAAFLIVSILGVLFIPGAVHTFSENFSEDLIGNWKGVFMHKNQAGVTMFFSIVLFVTQYVRTRNLIWILLSILAFIFLWFTKSKTSLYLLFPCLFLAYYFSSMKVASKFRFIFILMFMIFSIIPFMFIDLMLEKFEIFISDPLALTGRAAIWQILYNGIQDNFWLGVGYGSVWFVGDDSILFNYSNIGVKWIETLNQGHNSYLDLLFSVGFLGFILFFKSCVFDPLYNVFVNFKSFNKLFVFNFYAIIFFILAHGVTESNFLFADKGRWVVFLIFISLTFVNRNGFHGRK